MRALLTEPAAVSERHFQRFADRALVRGVLPDWLNRAEPYFTLNALILTAGEGAALRAATDAFARVFAKATAAVAPDVDRLVSFGFPWAAAEFLAQEPGSSFILGRFDFAPDAAGCPWVLECNADTPSGLREGAVVDALIHEWAPGAGAYAPLSGQLAAAFVRQVEAALTAPGGPPVERLGLVTEAGMIEDLAQFVFTRDLLARALAPQGIEVVLGDVDNLGWRRNTLCLAGRPVQALYRYYPFETLFGTPGFPAIYDAVFSGRLRLLNGLRGLLTQNKALLAWIWQHQADPLFTPEERAAIAAHFPPTHAILDLPPDFDYRHSVIKQVFGREGEEVYFGDRLSSTGWEQCRRWRSYIVQERIDVPPIDAVLWRRGGPAVEAVWPSLGAFVCGDRFAGCYSRVGGPIIDHSAKFLATWSD